MGIEKLELKFLAKEFNVSERTILRDLKEKIPFLIDTKILKENGKYFLEKNFDDENIILNFLIAESKTYFSAAVSSRPRYCLYKH